ncbi:BZIP domain-containing protein [Mycena indigotica]|uniref:BZIP domain-containing protein n=1 Tax=Mycena indigotica TaxID=2126181 RepID=A0A8H6TE56_9AGAR|nr:BZIP domain-containing protein [Mycena indigotica]KAF7315097.1 BZIP domain-containing protein [Mycena indigotica]
MAAPSASPIITLSSIITDAVLLSPTDSETMLQFSPTYEPYSYYPSPPMSVEDSPIPPQAMLRANPPMVDSQHCVTTSQLFDGTSFPPEPVLLPRPIKRSASPELQPQKRRAAAERVNSKDFIPPDVSGLSKREARLVKNRAAAFLSRQRKREEFELMEVRVAELEQENARLLAFASGTGPSIKPESTDAALVSEIEVLRAQLHAAQERERELNAELKAKSGSCDVPQVKMEPYEPSIILSSPSPRNLSPHKSAASLGLMQVLLCALPSLLSASTNSHSAMPMSFSFPQSHPASSSSTFDFHSALPNDFDWSGSLMDTSDKRRLTDVAPTTTTATHKLAFADTDSGVLAGLGGLDISFDASPSEDGKIRVRIHPSTSVSSRPPSPSASYVTKQDSPLGNWFGSQPESSESYSDPFLGVGGGYGSPHSSPAFIYNQEDLTPPSADYSDYSSDFGVPSEYSVGDASTGGKRRVRIALKSMPASDNECGEWEVEFC